jgi:hypothetical protein
MSVEVNNKVIYVGYNGEYPIEINASFGDMIGVLIQEMFKEHIWFKNSSDKSETYSRIYVETDYSDEEFENALKTLKKIINIEYEILVVNPQ